MDPIKRKRIDYVLWKKGIQILDDDIRLLEISNSFLKTEIGELMSEPTIIPEDITDKINELKKSKTVLKFKRKLMFILERNIEGVIKNETEREKEIRFNRDKQITKRV